MTDKKYNIALIGCGSMGAAHLDDIYYREDINVRCVCDWQLERAQSFQRLYNAQKTETDYQKVVEDDEIDIVIIATYPSTHLEILEKCIEHGKHVICEKPIAENLQNGKKVIELIKAHPEVKVLIGHILRHNKTYQKVAEMIQNGAIGSPIVMRMGQNHHTMDWDKYLKAICETSPIVDCGVHYVDVMRWFTGAEVVDVSGIGLRTEKDVPVGNYNYGLITVRMSDGSVARYEVGWGNTMDSDHVKEFVGPKGRIKIIYQMARTEHKEEGDLIEYYTYPYGNYESINILCKRKPTGAQLQMLIDMIENDSESVPTLDDVWKSFETVIKADEIIRKNLN